MSTTDMNVFYAADTFMMPLFDVDGRMRGAEHHMVNLGPWKLDTETIIVSDQLDAKLASYFVRLHNAVWAYLVVHDKGQTLSIVDGEELKLTPAGVTGFGTGDCVKTLKKMGNAVKCTYTYSHGKWEKFGEPSAGVVNGKAG